MPSTGESSRNLAQVIEQDRRHAIESLIAHVQLEPSELLAEDAEEEDDDEEDEDEEYEEGGPGYSDLLHPRRSRLVLGDTDSDSELDDILDDDDDARLPGDNGDRYLAEYWPGFVSTQPLNPDAPLLPTASTSLLSPPPNSDPSSATSPTSFLSPGVIFTGSQLFVPVSRRSPTGFPASRAPPRGGGLASTSSLPPTVPLAPSSASEAVMMSAVHRANLLFNQVGADRAEMEAAWRWDGERGEREGMSSAERRHARVVEETRELREVRSAMERLAGRAAGWREEAEGFMDTSGLEENAPVEEDEHWGVQVVIHSYSHQTQTIRGLMHALGVPDASAQIVTTHFQGDILNPAINGLLARKVVGAKKRDDSLYWAQLGPFKGLGKEELSARSSDLEWLRQRTEGWMLMSWQELDFINVTPAESTLSIAGHYLICMDRKTGRLEGLYVDPVSSPYQRLVLTPTTSSAPFSLGTFDFR